MKPLRLMCPKCPWHGQRRDRFYDCPRCAHPLALRPSEAAFQSQITGLADALGWWWWHDTDSRRNRAGLPDLIFGHAKKRRFFMAEVKTAGGKLSPIQIATIDTLRSSGVEVHAWWPHQWPEIERVLKGG